jgi:oxygen-dependent protoporphyrinogen oxidase
VHRCEVPEGWSRSGHDRDVCNSADVQTDGRSAGHVVVVGGGITGLATAWFLAQQPAGPQVTVLEASAEVGGKLRAGDLGGYAVDAGAESMLARRPEAVDLAQRIGMHDALQEPTTSAARLLVDGQLRHYPTGTVLGVPGDLRALASSRVLTWRGLARAESDRVLPVRAAGSDVSVGAYVTSRLGREVTQRLVQPLLGGVYAGDPHMLSLEATMPAIAAARARGERLTAAARRIRSSSGGTADGSAPFIGVVGGLHTMPAHLAERLTSGHGVDIRTRTTVRELGHHPDGGWRVVTGPVPAPQLLRADAVVLAVPAPAAARLVRSEVPGAAALLELVRYASVGLVAIGYRRADVPVGALLGSGHLVPQREGRAVKAVTYSSAKWDWVREAVPDLTVVRMSVGRFGDVRDLQRDDADLVRLASEDAADVLGLVGRPVAGSVFRWGGALPQYTVGHVSRARRVHALLAQQRGLAVAGAAVDGVGIPACIASAQRAAGQVLRSLGDDATITR